MLDAWLANAHRKLTDQQRKIVSAAFGKSESSRLPLYARLVYDLAIRWKSTTLPPPLPDNITDIIRYIFGRLEKDHGKIAPAALSYITCSKYGLSSNELEDVLSLDDEVLSDVFQWWNPPLRRIPPNLWYSFSSNCHHITLGFDSELTFKNIWWSVGRKDLLFIVGSIDSSKRWCSRCGSIILQF